MSEADEISVKEIFQYARNAIGVLQRTKMIIAASVLIGASIGFLYAVVVPIRYTAKLTFVVEEDKSGSGGLSGAMGLASTLGFDLGSSGSGIFSGSNLIAFMQSRVMVEKALLTSVKKDNDSITLADYYLSFSKDFGKVSDGRKAVFPVNVNRDTFTLQQDKLLGEIYETIVGKRSMFKVYQADKKVSIITVETTSIDELFSKKFTEAIVNEVSSFYIDTKSKKAKLNYEILAKQVDSIRSELNSALAGVAIVNENTFNLNSAMMLPKVAGSKRQVDVQANTAILNQLVVNLEMAKVTLRKETPLIQIIDRPIFPLQKERLGKIKTPALCGFLAGFFVSLGILFNHWRKKYLG